MEKRAEQEAIVFSSHRTRWGGSLKKFPAKNLSVALYAQPVLAIKSHTIQGTGGGGPDNSREGRKALKNLFWGRIFHRPRRYLAVSQEVAQKVIRQRNQSPIQEFNWI